MRYPSRFFPGTFWSISRRDGRGGIQSLIVYTTGSSIKYILITEAVARRASPPIYLARGQQGKFHSLIAAEEEEWDRQQQNVDGDGKGGDEEDGEGNSKEEEGAGAGRGGDQGAASFEEYRERSRSAGVM